MGSVFTTVVVSALAVLGLYYLRMILGELIFGRRGSEMIAVVPVAPPEMPLDEVLDRLGECAGIGGAVIVDYSGQLKTPEQIAPHGFRVSVTAPEHLQEVLQKMDTGH